MYMGCSKTVHVTDSKQGGVVKLPLYRKNVLELGRIESNENGSTVISASVNPNEVVRLRE